MIVIRRVFYLRFWCFFFFKQKTAYEMRISDWSSDVCSSDLQPGTIAFNETPEQRRNAGGDFRLGLGAIGKAAIVRDIDKGCGGQQAARGREHRQSPDPGIEKQYRQIGRASCRERVCQDV